jgi:hypothetical protein
MSWFENRNREGHEAESSEVKSRNQILQTPEKETPESKGKLDKFQNKSLEEQKQSLNEQSQAAKNRQKLNRPNISSNEGDPSKGQKQIERGHEMERE